MDSAIFIAARISRSGTKFFTQKDVSDPSCHERISQHFAVELRVKPTVRCRAYVSDYAYAVLREQGAEVLECVCGVAHCENIGPRPDTVT